MRPSFDLFRPICRRPNGAGLRLLLGLAMLGAVPAAGLAQPSRSVQPSPAAGASPSPGMGMVPNSPANGMPEAPGDSVRTGSPANRAANAAAGDGAAGDGAADGDGGLGSAGAVGLTGAAPGVADPVVASVEGHPIYLSDLADAAKQLPANMRALPFDTLYPVVLDRMIDHQSLVIMARREGLEERKAIKRRIRAAIDGVLEGAYLSQVTGPAVTEQAIKALYDREFANRPATEEVRARHILVTTEGEAMKVLDDLKKGADFATLARVVSKDPDGARGGELGFFRRDQVWPAFAAMAFSLKPGQISPKPVHNEFGWHIIQVEERRIVAPPTYAEMHDQLKQRLMAAAVQAAIKDARASLTIHRFNLDGSELETGLHPHTDSGGNAGQRP